MKQNRIILYIGTYMPVGSRLLPQGTDMTIANCTLYNIFYIFKPYLLGFARSIAKDFCTKITLLYSVLYSTLYIGYFAYVDTH